jgi:hypothetical protein
MALSFYPHFVLPPLHENSLTHNDHYMFPYNPHDNYRYSHDYNRQYRLTNSCYHNYNNTDFGNPYHNFAHNL